MAYDPDFNNPEYIGKSEPIVKNAEYLVFRQDLNAVMQHLAKEEGIDLTLDRKGQIPPKSLMSAIRYEFELSEYEYATATKDGKRYYPDLITNDEYWKILDKISDEGIPEKIKEELQKAEENLEDSEEGEIGQQNS